MKICTEPQVKHEIQRIDSLIRQLEGLHSEARALHERDLRESVLSSIDDLVESLRDERTKIQFLVEHHAQPWPRHHY